MPNRENMTLQNRTYDERGRKTIDGNLPPLPVLAPTERAGAAVWESSAKWMSKTITAGTLQISPVVDSFR